MQDITNHIPVPGLSFDGPDRKICHISLQRYFGRPFEISHGIWSERQVLPAELWNSRYEQRATSNKQQAKRNEQQSMILKITRHHHCFPHKDRTDDLESLLLLVIQDSLPRGALEWLSKFRVLPRSTLSAWQAKWRTDLNWRPSRKNYQIQRSSFTDEEEQELFTSLCIT
jgi:hypothetical protein